MATHKRVTNRANLAAEYGWLGLHILLLNSTLCAVYFVFSLSFSSDPIFGRLTDSMHVERSSPLLSDVILCWRR
jgi:hypothetical protein